MTQPSLFYLLFIRRIYKCGNKIKLLSIQLLQSSATMKEKSKYGMPPSTSRVEFEHNVFLLVADFERHKSNQSYLENRFLGFGGIFRVFKIFAQ